MFDPTAFDNMKVVIEGALYDLDLADKISIIDRNDLMNMAKLSRSFDVSFHQFETEETSVTARIEIESNLTNLAAELLPGKEAENQSGCTVKLEFFFMEVTEEEHLRNIDQILLGIWGESRTIRQAVVHHLSLSMVNNVITIEFDRIIREQQLDDVVEMIDYMIVTLSQLQSYLMEI